MASTTSYRPKTLGMLAQAHKMQDRLFVIANGFDDFYLLATKGINGQDAGTDNRCKAVSKSKVRIIKKPGRPHIKAL